jgi:hypothetical protein
MPALARYCRWLVWSESELISGGFRFLNRVRVWGVVVWVESWRVGVFNRVRVWWAVVYGRVESWWRRVCMPCFRVLIRSRRLLSFVKSGQPIRICHSFCTSRLGRVMGRVLGTYKVLRNPWPGPGPGRVGSGLPNGALSGSTHSYIWVGWTHWGS